MVNQMIKKYFLILFSILLICSIYFVLDDNKYTKKKIKDGILVSFSTDKKVYQKDEEFIVTYKIKNISPVPQKIQFDYDGAFSYSFLKVEPKDRTKYYDSTFFKDYDNNIKVGINGITIEPGESMKTVYKYVPKKGVNNQEMDKIIFSSNFEGSSLDVNLSFPISFQK